MRKSNNRRSKQSNNSLLVDFITCGIVQTVKVANKDESGTIWALIIVGIAVFGILAEIFG